MMQRVCAHWPKYAASLLVLALVALAAMSIARAPQERIATHQAPEVSAVYPGSGATLSGSVKPQPYLRSASRTQSGLRSKTSADPAGKAVAEGETPLARFSLQRSDLGEGEAHFPSSFVALRALGPRAPPAHLT